MLHSTILVIDNTEDCLIAATRALMPKGFGLVAAKNMEKGLEMVSRYQPDVIVLADSCLNNPLNLIYKLDQMKSCAQTLVVACEPDFEQSMEWVQNGVFSVLAKPIKEEALIRGVTNALSQRETLRRMITLTETKALDSDNMQYQILTFCQGLLERLDTENLVRYMSKAFKRLTGAKEVDILLCESFIPPRFFRNGEAVSQDMENFSMNANRWVSQSIDLSHKTRRFGEMVLYFEKLEELEELDRQLLDKLAVAAAASLDMALKYQNTVNLASKDSLTGLFNRRVFTETLKREFAEAKRHNQALSLLILDLDHFKAVNDNFGHQTGDEVLKAVAQVMFKICRETDIPARIGGEEFAIILPHTTQSQAFYFAERLKVALADYTDNPATALVRQTISQGVAGTEHFMVNFPEDLVYWADQALYLAKHEGRDTIRLASDLPLKPMLKDGQYAFQ